MYNITGMSEDEYLFWCVNSTFLSLDGERYREREKKKKKKKRTETDGECVKQREGKKGRRRERDGVSIL